MQFLGLYSVQIIGPGQRGQTAISTVTTSTVIFITVTVIDCLNSLINYGDVTKVNTLF